MSAWACQSVLCHHSKVVLTGVVCCHLPSSIFCLCGLLPVMFSGYYLGVSGQNGSKRVAQLCRVCRKRAQSLPGLGGESSLADSQSTQCGGPFSAWQWRCSWNIYHFLFCLV